MYSNFKSIQILIAILKEYNINDVVLSPGGSDIPIIHSLEGDSFFRCYSVVDERSAVYFAIGVSQSKNRPVACVCTSGTAVSNYLPGMTEAYYQNVPIIAITADKNPYFNGQIETQKITQNGIFGEVSLKSVEIPTGISADELWYTERVIKEAILVSLYKQKGPVHINIPIVGSYSGYDVKELPSIKRVNYVTCENSDNAWKKYQNKIESAKRILIVVGQNIVFSEIDKRNIELFFSRYNCMFSVEHLSNLSCKGCIYTYPFSETHNLVNQAFVPDLVISFGNNISSYCLKPFLRANYKKFDHISIDETGRYRDVFKGLTDIFVCSPSFFFEYFTKSVEKVTVNDMSYYNLWVESVKKIRLPELKFSNFFVAKKLSAIIPENSLVHLAILNSIRIMQFFELKKTIRTFANIGALGIDGCLSSFIGAASTTSELCFCLIGDLSFFYDMNAIGIRHLSNNSRIVLLNNGGGSEFNFFINKKDIPTLNNYICAEHTKTAKGWVESLGFKYYKASSKEELDRNIIFLSKDSDVPIFLEVFTDKEEDAELTRSIYSLNSPADTIKTTAKKVAKKIITILKK